MDQCTLPTAKLHSSQPIYRVTPKLRDTLPLCDTNNSVYKNNSSAGRETAWSLVSLFRYGKSLKVIWNDTLEYIYIQRDPVVTMSVCRTVSEIYSASKWYDHQNQGYRGHSRLLKMPPFDRPHTTYYQSAIVIALVYVISFLSYLTISSSKWSIMCRMVR